MDQPVPSQRELMWPALRAIQALGGSANVRDLYDRVIGDEFPSGAGPILRHGNGRMTELEYRLRWALTRLKHVGAVINSRRNVWEITAHGLALDPKTVEFEDRNAHKSGSIQGGTFMRPVTSRTPDSSPPQPSAMGEGEPPGDTWTGPAEGRHVLGGLTNPALLALHGQVMGELRTRGLVRSANGPAGDYGERVVWLAMGGELATNSEKSWDLRLPDSTRVQVKTRVVSDINNAGQRQLSVIRSWDFEQLAIVLFSPDFSIRRCVLLPAGTAQESARFRTQVNGFVLFAKDALLNHPLAEDVTEMVRAAGDDPTG